MILKVSYETICYNYYLEHKEKITKFISHLSYLLMLNQPNYLQN
jgi:hypothetical protein